MQPTTDTPDYGAIIHQWERDVPWWRRCSARIGIQGKLFLGFIVLLALALAGSYYLFLGETQRTLITSMGEHALRLSQVVAKASESALTQLDFKSLHRIGRDLLKDRDIVSICFYDASGQLVVLESRDPDLSRKDNLYPRVLGDMQNLMQTRLGYFPALGHFVEVSVPVLRLLPAQESEDHFVDQGPDARVLGYVSLSLSIDATTRSFNRVNLLVLVLGGVLFVLTIPVVYVLVHRILSPIRQLVITSKRIAGGDLDAQSQVEVHRPDVIGTLSRAFNEMVIKVRQHQQMLASANDQLAAANRDLEAKVLQRTSQMESANKRLSSEIAEKEDFLRAVSHDLNAPLRNISGMASMLVMKYRDRFDEDILHRLDRIQKNVQAETDLISELLELSRIKTRRGVLKPVDMHALVQHLAEIFDNDLKTRNIELIVETPLPVLHCESARIGQVLQNLIDNAIKYMDEKPQKSIRIGCTVWMDEAEFYVRDNGMGIEPEDQEKIFYVFRRGRSQAVNNVAGKGVGLASVKSIVETYNGAIRVVSQPGEGTTFFFTINGQYVPACSTAVETSECLRPNSAEPAAAVSAAE
ncbi:MAG: HAMP domain-containing protein [Phycisphaerales bacterium]|nr:HAMP domain-containing protein [Phycisphaerales bacterium]